MSILLLLLSLVFFVAFSFLEWLKASTITEMNSELITHTLKNTNEYRYSWLDR